MMNRVRKRFILWISMLALLILLFPAAQVVHGAAPTPTPAARIGLRKAFQLKLDEYVRTVQPGAARRFILTRTHSNGTFAYNTAQELDAHGRPVVESYVVLLAHRDPRAGWSALAPRLDSAQRYNALLSSFPAIMIDANTRNYLLQARPNPRAQAGSANFSQHRLPFPAGNSGYVPKKDVPGHENQVDFDITPSDTIYASRPGTVVFVKESSTTNCTAAPPDNCWQNANMVVIQHAPGEYSWYVHLAHNSVPVSVGTYVGAGTKIGVEGMTGYASGVHLHYMASNSVPAWTDPAVPSAAPWPAGIQPVDFDEVSWANLNMGSSYVSRNTSDPSVAAWGSGREDLFVKAQDNVLWHRAYTGGWGGWDSLGGILTSSPDAVSWGTGHLDVYARGLDNNIYYRRYLNGAWADWLSAGQPPVGARSDPSAASLGSGRVDLFVRGGDNALWHRSYANAGWATWESLGGVLTTGPDVAAPVGGQLQVFLAGVNNQMWRCTYNGACAWDQVTGGLATYDQSGVSPSAGRTDVFARGITDGQLYHRYWNSAWSAWEPLGGIMTSGPDAASWQGGFLDVFVRGTDDNVWHRSQNAGIWSGWAAAGAPPIP